MRAALSVAQAQYDLMLAGYRDEEWPGRRRRRTGASRL